MIRPIDDPTEVPHRHAHPSVFLFLFLPYGIVTGYVSVTFAYLFSKAGVSVEAVAGLIAASTLPHVLKFLWAPVVDSTLTLKKWYVLGTVITTAAILATGLLPARESSLPLMTIIIVTANVAVTFSCMATNGLMAHDTPEGLRGTAGGYLQAGNLGGAGIGGGAGLWLAQHIQPLWISPAALALSCLLCCISLFFIREVETGVKAEQPLRTLANLFRDLWGTMKTRLGVLALVLCFLPLGTGSASNLWAAIAGDWHATADTVAIVTGVMGGIVTTVGCLVGGWLCDRMHRQIAYVAFGLAQAASAVGMAYAPHTEMTYIVWTLVYAATNGLAYAAFTAFVLDAIGKGAAATKYTVYASLSNFPIYYMVIVDGWAYTHYGPRGMLNTEATCAVIGAVLFMVLFRYSNAKAEAAVA